MEERRRDDGFEATFVVATPRETAWEWLAGARPAFDTIGEARPGQWWIPAIAAPGAGHEADPRRLLRARKAGETCKGTEIVITLEDENGTRITIVQTGFGPNFDQQRPWLEAGWYTILADLA